MIDSCPFGSGGASPKWPGAANVNCLPAARVWQHSRRSCTEQAPFQSSRFREYHQLTPSGSRSLSAVLVRSSARHRARQPDGPGIRCSRCFPEGGGWKHMMCTDSAGSAPRVASSHLVDDAPALLVRQGFGTPVRIRGMKASGGDGPACGSRSPYRYGGAGKLCS